MFGGGGGRAFTGGLADGLVGGGAALGLKCIGGALRCYLGLAGISDAVDYSSREQHSPERKEPINEKGRKTRPYGPRGQLDQEPHLSIFCLIVRCGQSSA